VGTAKLLFTGHNHEDSPLGSEITDAMLHSEGSWIEGLPSLPPFLCPGRLPRPPGRLPPLQEVPGQTVNVLCKPPIFYVEHLTRCKELLARRSDFQKGERPRIEEAQGAALHTVPQNRLEHAIERDSDVDTTCSSDSWEAVSENFEIVQSQNRTVQEDQDISSLEELPDLEANGFSVILNTLAGSQTEIGGLSADTHVQELAQRVASKLCIPLFAVTLNCNGQMLTADSPMYLEDCSISEGSDLYLVKCWGWGKPDMRLLEELHKKCEGKAVRSDH